MEITVRETHEITVVDCSRWTDRFIDAETCTDCSYHHGWIEVKNESIPGATPRAKPRCGYPEGERIQIARITYPGEGWDALAIFTRASGARRKDESTVIFDDGSMIFMEPAPDGVGVDLIYVKGRE